MCASRPERACAAAGTGRAGAAPARHATVVMIRAAGFARARPRPRSSRRRGSGSRSAAAGRARRRRRGGAVRAARPASRGAGGLEEIAEQVVQAQRRLGALEDRDEEAAPLDLLEPVRRARIGARRRRSAPSSAREHRAAQQEASAARPASRSSTSAAGSRRHGGRCYRASAAWRRRGGAGRSARLLTARRRPTAQPWVRWEQRLLVASGRTRRALRAAGRAPRRGEAQVALAELGQLAVRAQPRQRQRRSVRLDRTTPHCGGSRSSSRSRNSNTAGSLDAVRVVDDDQAALDVAGGEGVEQLVGHRWRSLRLPPASAIRARGRCARADRAARARRTGRRAGRAGRRRRRSRSRPARCRAAARSGR